MKGPRDRKKIQKREQGNQASKVRGKQGNKEGTNKTAKNREKGKQTLKDRKTEYWRERQTLRG